MLKVVRGDKYPQNICTICLNKLKSAYTFKKQCQEIQIKFEQYLQNIIIKEGNLFVDNNYTIKDESNGNWNDNFYDSSLTTPEKYVNTIEDDGEKNVDANITNQDKIENKSLIKKKKLKAIRKRDHVCSICNKKFTSTYLKFHMRFHTKEKPYKCDECGQQFSLKGNYERHRKIHTGERPHMCSKCGRSFLQKSTLNQHLLIHTDETPFMCPQCGRRFKHKSPLQWHIRTKHNPCCENVVKDSNARIKHRPQLTSNFECDICHKILSTKKILATHSLIHGEKSYLCSYCGKGFVSRNRLRSHLRTHTGEKPYKCMLCNKAFSQFGTLKSHRLTHTGERPFTCDICNQSFKQISNLKAHRQTHSSEKLFNCSICGKYFSTNGTLTVHMRTHTGETPFICSVCDKGFYNSSNMKRHKKKHFTGQENEQKKSFDLSLTKFNEK